MKDRLRKFSVFALIVLLLLNTFLLNSYNSANIKHIYSPHMVNHTDNSWQNINLCPVCREIYHNNIMLSQLLGFAPTLIIILLSILFTGHFISKIYKRLVVLPNPVTLKVKMLN